MAHGTIIGTVTAKPETREGLEGLLAAQLDPTRVEPGCINYDVHVDARDPRVFVCYKTGTARRTLTTISGCRT
jgi:quinol monooxygenase YgiN